MWDATLPAPAGNIEHLVAFGSKIVDAGKAHHVWDMHRYVAGAGTGDTFESHVRTAALTGKLPLLLRRREDPEPGGTVAVFRDDGIVEVVTSDLGRLLSELRPERSRTVVRSAPPVVVVGGAYDVDRAEGICISVRLDTDIWFPRVCGMHEDLEEDMEEFPESYDNVELARRHTPRFNLFLREVRAATLAAGGTWELSDPGGISVNYQGAWNLDGIELRAISRQS